MQIKFSASSSVWTSVSFAYWGEKLYSYDAEVELFAMKLRQMVVLSWNFFMYVMYGVLGPRLLLGTLKPCN